MTMVKLWLRLLLLLSATTATARLEGGYELRHRPQQQQPQQQRRELQTATATGTVFLTLDQLQSSPEWRLSWSQDSDPVRLPAFYVSVFDTDGSLPAIPSVATIQSGLDAFLTAELNARYGANHQVRACSAAVLAQTNAAASRLRFRRRHLQEENSMGSQLETQVDVQFQYQPTPSRDDVQAAVAAILEQRDLLNTHLVNNVTALAAANGGDPELANVNAIYYLGWVPADEDGDGGAADDGGDGGAPVMDGDATPRDAPQMKDRMVLYPLILVAVAVLAVVALLVYKRKRRQRQRETHHTSASSVNLMHQTGINNDHEYYLKDADGDDDGGDREVYNEDDVNLYYARDKLYYNKNNNKHNDDDDEDYYDQRQQRQQQAGAEDTDIFSVEAALSPKSRSPQRSLLSEEEGDSTTDDDADDDGEDDPNVVFLEPTVETPTSQHHPPGGDAAESPAGRTLAAAACLTAASTLGMESPRPSATNLDGGSSPRQGGHHHHYPSESKSVFSFLSGFTSRGEASTVVASNVTKGQNNSNGDNSGGSGSGKSSSGVGVLTPTSPGGGGNTNSTTTPHSTKSSLFTFSEEEEDGGGASRRRTRQLAEIQVPAATSSEDDDDEASNSNSNGNAILERYADRVEAERAAGGGGAGDGDDDIVMDVAPRGSSPTRAGCVAPPAWLVDKYNPKNNNTASGGNDNDDDDDDSMDRMLAEQQQQEVTLLDDGLAAAHHNKNLDIMNDLALAEQEKLRRDNISTPRAFLLPTCHGVVKKPACCDDDEPSTGPAPDRARVAVGAPRQAPSPLRVTATSENDDDDDTTNHSGSETGGSSSGGGSKVIQLQWDDPDQAELNKKAAAAFAERVATSTATATAQSVATGETPGSGGDGDSFTSSVARYIHSPPHSGGGGGGDRRGFNNNRAASLPSSPTEAAAAAAAEASRNSHRFSLSPRRRGGSRRISSGSAGFADGTSSYQNRTASAQGVLLLDEGEDGTDAVASGSQQQQQGINRTLTPEEADEYIVKGAKKLATLEPLDVGRMDDHGDDDDDDRDDGNILNSEQHSRIHTKNTAGDGSTNYQNETMGHYSVENTEDNEEEMITASSPRSSETDSRKRRMRMSLSQVVFGSKKSSGNKGSKKPPMSPRRATAKVKSPAVSPARTSVAASPASGTSSQSGSASKQLISDLLWLEQKIAATNHASPHGEGTPRADPDSPSDSLSFASGDDGMTDDHGSSVDHSNEASNATSNNSSSRGTGPDGALSQSIICRDCYAPPGKLKIVIHSTKDGPAVHTVKKGSSLEGHIFPGDLIISVDNVDTRSYSAEQVMKMMTAKTRFERKITVLHFEDDNANDSV